MDIVEFEKTSCDAAAACREKDDLRQHKRWPILWSASIRLAGHDFPCQIWNLSLGGAQLRSDVPLRSGTDIVISIDGLPEMPGKLVWHKDETFGFQFSVSADEVMNVFAKRLEVFRPVLKEKDKSVESAA